MDGGEKCSLSLSPSSCAFPDDFRLKFMTFYDPRDHMEILNETHIVTIPALCRRPCVPFRSTARDKDKSWWPSLSTHNPETEKKKKQSKSNSNPCLVSMHGFLGIACSFEMQINVCAGNETESLKNRDH